MWNGYAIQRDDSTSSIVSGSRIIARGLSCAHLRVATATSARCSLVVPYSCMWRIAAIEYVLGAPPTPNGVSNCDAGNDESKLKLGRGPRRLRDGKQASPWGARA